MKDEESYPAGVYWVVTKQLGYIGRNEADGVEGHLGGQVLYLKSLVATELEANDTALERWNEAAEKVEDARNDAERKRARLEQLEVLVALMKYEGILMDRDLKPWDLESFEGKAMDVEE